MVDTILEASKPAQTFDYEKADIGNPAEHFLHGVWNGVKMPVEGAAQLAGADVHPYYGHGLAENAGMMVGEGAWLVASTVGLRKFGVGRIAAPIAAAGLGFLMPTQANQGMTDRFARAGLAAATVGTFEYAPDLIGRLGVRSNLAKTLLGNGAAGAVFAQGESLYSNHRPAGLVDTAITAGTFSVAGLAGRGLGDRIGVAPWVVSAQNLTELGLSNPKPEYTEPKVVDASEVGQLTAGDYRVRMNSQGGTREYDIHIPKGYDGTRPLATTMVLDGVNPGLPGNMARETQFNKYSDQSGVAVIYPYAKTGHGAPLTGDVASWNAKDTGLTNYDPSYDDMQFLKDVIADVSKHVNIDRSKLSGVGFSEGAMILEKFAAENPGTFDAVASVHGTLNGKEKLASGFTAKDAPNVLVIGSTTDYMLPFNGGKGLMTATMDKAGDSKPYMQAPFWANAAGANSVERQSTPVFDKLEFKADGQTRVTQYIVNGGVHSWDGSGSEGWPLVGRPLRRDQFDTSAVVWKFFRDSDEQRR